MFLSNQNFKLFFISSKVSLFIKDCTISSLSAYRGSFSDYLKRGIDSFLLLNTPFLSFFIFFYTL